MSAEAIDWEKHVKAYKSSRLSRAAYCKIAGLNLGTFANQLRRFNFPTLVSPASHLPPTAAFKQFKVSRGIELLLSVENDGQLTLKNIDPRHLPLILESLCAIQR